MITKTLKSINDKIRNYKKYSPPQPNNSDLPPTFNIILSSSPKGGGKTYNAIQLLTAYENSGFKTSDGTPVRMRTIWISGGTSNSKQNAILDTLKTLHKNDKVDIESDVDEKLQEIYDQLLAERDNIIEYNEYRRIYKKFMKTKNINTLTDDELQFLEWKSYITPDEDPLKPMDDDGNELFFPRMVFLIADDLIGSDAFSTKKNSFLNRLAVKSRHESEKLVGINLFFITQSFKAIPPVIRKQTDLFVLLKSASREYIIDNISFEVGSHFTKEEIGEYYDEIMKIDYGSLILSIHKQEKSENRVRQGWSKIVERDKKYLL
jgi:hypothetical protein